MKDKTFCEDGFLISPCGPTTGKGVYAICVMESYKQSPKLDLVVYIGSSNNIQKRIMKPSHVYRRLVNLLKNYWVYTFYLECDNHVAREKELIRKYQPRFNRMLYGA